MEYKPQNENNETAEAVKAFIKAVSNMAVTVAEGYEQLLQALEAVAEQIPKTDSDDGQSPSSMEETI